MVVLSVNSPDFASSSLALQDYLVSDVIRKFSHLASVASTTLARGFFLSIFFADFVASIESVLNSALYLNTHGTKRDIFFWFNSKTLVATFLPEKIPKFLRLCGFFSPKQIEISVFSIHCLYSLS